MALLLEPLRFVEKDIQGPILIVLDALDECGDPESRRALLSLLSNDFPQIPPLFRFLITSRRDFDITAKFKSRFMEMDLDTGSLSNTMDVEFFIRHEMVHIQRTKGLSPDWPGEDKIHDLVQLSGGLFIWASTAIRFINNYLPDERLERLITQNHLSGFDLDSLYSVALRNSGPWDTDETFARDARAVLACVVLAREPIADRTINMLLGVGDSSNVLGLLGSVIEWTAGKEARILHASFADYLTDPARSGGQPWAIDLRVHHLSLSLGCLRILWSELRFNICNLEDSHCRNAEVPQLAHRIETMISPQLSYSCRFWFDHMQKTTFDTVILDDVNRLLQYQFLHWLEALSLLDQFHRAKTGLETLAKYVKVSNQIFIM
jgi:hypothetical protein